MALACIVPLMAGGAGAISGPAMAGRDLAVVPPDLESHFRYLSGLLLGLGIAFAASIPTIERRSELFTVLTFIIVIGGTARLVSAPTDGFPGTAHVLAIEMELGVVPLLFAWQRRVARLFR